jgi:type 1 glutamine amidotransferase
MTGIDYQRPPYPLAWARMHGKGRVWFHAHGHREETWTDPKFQGVLIAAINWAGRRIDADVTPNLATAAPEAATLPPAR